MNKTKTDPVPLLLAMENNHHNIVRLLLNGERFKDSSANRRLLAMASQTGFVDVLRLLLDVHQVETQFSTEDLEGAYNFAIENMQDKVVELMLESRYSSKSAIMRKRLLLITIDTSWNIEPVIINTLQQTGLDLNCQDENTGETLLHKLARGFKFPNIVRALLSNQSVDPDVENDQGRTPLSYAAQYGNHIMVSLLLCHPQGVDVDAKDAVWGRTPLSWVSMKFSDDFLFHSSYSRVADGAIYV